nr:helix-turn-helix transcriptional regulator [Actinokineospora iranica]
MLNDHRANLRRRMLGDEIRQARERANLTQSTLARRVGWPHSKLCRVETGKLGCSEVEAAIALSACRVARSEIDRIIDAFVKDADGAWIRSNRPLPDQLRTLERPVPDHAVRRPVSGGQHRNLESHTVPGRSDRYRRLPVDFVSAGTELVQ